MEIFDLSTLITIGIAVFVFLRLRSVLGQRHGPKPPMDRRNDGEQNMPREMTDDVSNDNVVTLPSRKSSKSKDKEAKNPDLVAIDEIAKPRTKLNKALRAILVADSNFDPRQFLSGGKMAYEMIVSAYADGDRKSLKGLLSKEVYDGFSQAISDREDRGDTVKSTFVGIETAAISHAEISDDEAQIAIRFVSEIVSATYDSENELIDGDPEQIAEVTDIWTFARDLNSNDPNWKLVATESES
ncbi:MAG: Tim44 domain-containing protein [Rhizobiaceae bacterium]|nr:Tim44 domain-containing protein [Rhizobiaceae bacterium]